MDPLTVITSVVGLLKAAKTLSSLLYGLKTIHDAPKSIGSLLSQVKHLEMLLTTVEKFLVGLESAPAGRTSLIQVDDLVTILTDLVLAFSELHAIAQSVSKESGPTFKGRWIWPWKEGIVSKIAARLESHKSSLSLMLNIAQCQSDIEARKSQQTLQALVKELVESNADISRRLRAFEERADCQSLLTIRAGNGRSDPSWGLIDPEFSSIIDTDCSDNISPWSFGAPLSISSLFEIDLANSRVYQRTELYECDASFVESNVRTHAWSIFSGLSLSEISIIAAIAVPIFQNDISNAHCYQFREDYLTDPRPDDKSSIVSKEWPVLTQSLAFCLVVADLGGSLSVNRANKILDLMVFWNMYPIARGDRDIKTSALCMFSRAADAWANNYFDVRGEADIQRRTIDGISFMIPHLTFVEEDYMGISQKTLHIAQGFILAYSCANHSEFWQVQEYHAHIQRAVELDLNGVSPFTRVPFQHYTTLLVGIVSHDNPNTRKVSTQEGQKLANDWGCSFMEVEPTVNGVEEAIWTLVENFQTQRAEVAKGRKVPAQFQRSRSL